MAWVKLVPLFPISRNCQGFLFQSLENSQSTSLLCPGTLHLLSPNQFARSLHGQHCTSTGKWQASAGLKGGKRVPARPGCPLPVRQQSAERGTWCPLPTTGCQEGRTAAGHWKREGPGPCPLWLSAVTIVTSVMQPPEAESSRPAWATRRLWQN